jgi:hypothetical protein
VLLALLGLGAFHGVNPGMGWLFAVAIGLQERSRAELLRALGPIAAGHAASVALIAVAVTVTGAVVATRWMAIGGGALLVAFGMWRLLSRRHFRWVGMRLSGRQLMSWSFLMSSVHGAGLMLLPVLAPGDHPGLAAAVLRGLAATGVHTVAMTAVAGLVAILVYQVVGLRVLRSAWVNLDSIWALALVGAGAATVLAA